MTVIRPDAETKNKRRPSPRVLPMGQGTTSLGYKKGRQSRLIFSPANKRELVMGSLSYYFKSVQLPAVHVVEEYQ
ncbi:MAG: hypothetical protein ACOWWR_16505, partial [Eubacteriales bacterium]